jgi:hypothetical protein
MSEVTRRKFVMLLGGAAISSNLWRCRCAQRQPLPCGASAC